MTQRIHITGASGSGTTTLGRALALSLGCPHFDTDDYFWLPTDPPYTEVRPVAERQALLGADLGKGSAWVLSGALGVWGEMFVPLFDLVVFLWVPTPTRLARLAERERRRFGEAALAPGGVMHTIHTAFMAWAAAYDEGGPEIRSRRRHEAWLDRLPCPVLRLEADQSVEERVAEVMRALAALPSRTLLEHRSGETRT